MSEILCPLCNAQSPENALYCQQCSQPLRCKNCKSALLPNARACIQCGQLIPERSGGEQFPDFVGIGSVPPGYNRLKMHETPDVRDLDLIVSNEAIEHIRDFFPPLVGNRPIGRNNRSVGHQTQQQTDLVEAASEIPSPQPQLPAASSHPAASQEGIWEIFRDHEGRLTQERRDLKASSKRDYIIRLAHLYMLARYQLGDEKVPRDDVFKILDEAGVKETHRSSYIHDSGIQPDENETLRLTLDGRDRAQRYLAEALDSQSVEGWRQRAESRSAGNQVKKPAKKGTEPRSSIDKVVAGWVSHEETRTLAATIPYSTIVNLSILDKSLLALYGIYRAGSEQEVPVASIAKYLYDAFQVRVESQVLSSAFYKARQGKTSKTSYVNFVEGRGYKITPLGREHIEDLLNLKQPKVATSEVNAGSNGVVQ